MNPEMMSTELEKIPCALHPQDETRLRCTECETPICPKCMVMYEAGFKCPGCAGKRQSHIITTQAWHRIVAGILAFLAGFGYGFLHPNLMAFAFFRIWMIPVLALILAYLIGKWTGNIIHKLVQYKMGGLMSAIVVMGGTAGLLLGPFHQELLAMLAVLNSVQQAGLGQTSAVYYVLGQGFNLLAGYLFIRGLRYPFAFR